MQIHRAPLLAIVATLVGSAPASAQTEIRTFDDPALSFDFGFEVRALDDITGDGVQDVAVGGPATGGGFGGARIYDGQTGALVHSLTSPTAGNLYGSAIDGLGDVTGDGVPEIIVAGPGSPAGGPVPIPGLVRVIDGQTGAVHFSLTGTGIIQFGYAVAGLDDVDGDGVPDFAVAANLDFSAGSEAGRVLVYSGASAAPLYDVVGAGADERFGTALAAVSDVDGDGIGDWLVGAPGALYAQLRSGVDGAHIRTFTDSFLSRADFGWSVDGIGDVDHDGVEDVIVGSPRELTNNGDESGRARVFSGGTGALLFTMTGGFSDDRLGFDVSGAGDLDFDGTPDILVGATLTNSISFYPTGLVFGVSGADWSTLFVNQGGSVAAQNGWSVDEIADTNGNGFHELLAGVPGRAEAKHWDFEPDSFGTRYCVASPNSTGNPATITAIGSPSVAANDLILHAFELPASQNGLFFYGPIQAQAPFGNGFLCVAAGGIGIARLAVVQATPLGIASYPVDNTNPPTMATRITAGSTWNFQDWYRDPAAGGAFFNLSDAVTLTFAP